MRRGVAVLVSITAVVSLPTMTLANKAATRKAAHKSAARGAARSSIEKSLLGVHLLQSYSVVLRLYGQPSRILPKGESLSVVESTDARGNLTGGIRAIDTGTMMAGGQMGGSRLAGGTASPFGRPGGMTGFPGGAGMMPGMMGGIGGGGSRRNEDDGDGPRMAGGGGLSGFPGGAGMMPGASGMTGGYNVPSPEAGPNDKEGTFGAAGGFTWVYFNAKKELLTEFFFNRDGRTEIIRERGRINSDPRGRTSKGIVLGSPSTAVYNAYGWPDSTEQDGRYLNLFYGLKHVQFTLINNKVVGINVMLREDQKVLTSDTNVQQPSNGMAPGMGMGRAPGMPGMAGPGMMGRGGAFGGGRSFGRGRKDE